MYLLTGWRHLRKNWFHSLLNISGLSIGLAFAFLISAYVWREWKVNDDLANAGHQYIIQSRWKDPGMGMELTTAGPLARQLKEQYPNLVANFYRWDGISSNVSKGDKVFREGLQVGDSTFLTMYGFPVLHGNARTALNQPFSLVITESKAKKYFGHADVVGQTLTIENFSGAKHDFIINAVLKDLQDNSITHLNGSNDNQFFIPLSNLSFFNRNIENWNNLYVVGYLELRNGVQPADLVIPINQLLKQNTPEQVHANLTAYLVPLKKFYLEKDNGLVEKMLFTVSFIALFILLMAIINFINISISKSSSRIREIGVRKVLGGLRIQLIRQFLTESFLVVFIAGLLGLGIYSVSGPLFSQVLGKQIPSISEIPFHFFFFLILLVMLVGFLAGLYPALILSSAKTADSLKGKISTVKENIFLRKSLVGFQFFIASVVLIGAIVVSSQVSYFFGKNLGYDKEYIVSAQLPRNWTREGVRKMQTIRNEFARMPEVQSVSLSYSIPNGGGIGTVLMFPQGKDSTAAIPLETIVTDEFYASTYKIPLETGRYFQYPADSLNIVINQTAARAYGWKNEEAIGKKIISSGNLQQTVIGVIRDFHFGSMQEQIRPLVIVPVDLFRTFRYMSFKIRPGSIATSLEVLGQKWSSLLPGTAFEYNFMDETLSKLYQSEIRLKKAAQTGTLLSLIIVMLGIVGLISLNIQKRTKEIGIRKVLGASSLQVIQLFLKEFIPVIITSGLIAIPLSWYLVRNWLDDYAYRIGLSALPFLVSVISLALLTSVLISIQIARAVIENPVRNLRTE